MCKVAPVHPAPLRDPFFWLCQINKASLVINTEQGLLDPTFAPRFARAIAHVERGGIASSDPANDAPDAKPTSSAPGVKPSAATRVRRPGTVITFEPLLIEAAGQETTLLHAGRSSQDMHGTFYAAIMRDNLLDVAACLDVAREALLECARTNLDTIVPNYTNGVAAQPNSYAHYLLGFAAGFARDAERLRQVYARLDRCPMGTTVLNGTSWPLDRDRMAAYLGFTAVADNAYDAVQIASAEYPADTGGVVTAIALHTGAFIEDVMTQYAQPRPWILLREGGDNTYVSSAMPQKRNPGILNNTRRDASTAIGHAMGAVMRAHNIPPGMVDPKSVPENTAMLSVTASFLRQFTTILRSLVIDPARALEELNNDWTASQEVADALMRNHGLPFRIGHHVASEMVRYGKEHDITPLNFPFGEVRRIYAGVVGREGAGARGVTPEMPMSEEEFRGCLNPVAIVHNRATRGGPQPAEVERMLREAEKTLACDRAWTAECRERIRHALERLDADFSALRQTSD